MHTSLLLKRSTFQRVLSIRMASNITAQSVLADLSRGHLECPICNERFKQPKQLECSHSFCLECLQRLLENSPSTTKLSCPLCRKETLLKENGIDGLTMDFKSISLKGDFEEQETKLKQQQGNQVHSQEYVSKCSKHTDKDLSLYCNKCKKLICTSCMLNSHQSHSLMEINEFSGKCKKQATELITKIEQSIETFKVAIQEIDMSKETLGSVFAATKEKISKKADAEKQKLMQEAEQIYQDRVKTMETARATNSIQMNKAEYQKDDVNQIMDQESCEIVHRMDKLLKDLKEYKQTKPTKVPAALTYMEFKEGQKPLGRLVLKDEQQLASAISAVARKFVEVQQFVKSIKRNSKWTLKLEKKMYLNRAQQTLNFAPHDVAAYSNNIIVVSNRGSVSLITISAESNPQSTVIPQALPIKGLTGPSRVTVNKNDELIVLDEEAVKIFSRSYQLLSQFRPGMLSDSQPTCIAVDDNNLIAVGYYTEEEISLHKPDGSLIKTLPAPGIGDYMTVYKQQLIYTNYNAKKLVSVDFNGEVVFSVDTNQYWWPCDVCCDKDGSIYVGVRKGTFFSSPGEIHHYSPDGKYIGCIIKSCTNQHGITFTPAGDLVVAAHNSVQMYHNE